MSDRGKQFHEIVAEWAAPQPPPTSERLLEMEHERQLAEQARTDARKPVEMKPGTKIKVHIHGWRYDPRPAEVVHDNMDRMNRQITAKRIRGNGDAEQVTVRFESVSLWKVRQ